MVIWENPPGYSGVRGRPSPWNIRLSPCCERPGCWARVHEYKSGQVARSTVWNLRNGRLCKPPGRWEFAARGTRVYGRYLGPAE